MTRGTILALLGAGLLVAALGAGCGGEEETVPPEELAGEEAELTTFELTSSAFADGAEVPTRYTCDGEDLPPPLAWNDPPAVATSFALFVDDPDAPGGAFTHWLAWEISPINRDLPEGTPPPLEGKNGFGKRGYGGPCPPAGDGPHRYIFRLYALDEPLDLEDGADKGAFQDALEDHVVAVAELVATYER